MPSDSANVDAAVIAKLVGDATLASLAPHGVYRDVAGSYMDAGTLKRATRFVVISQLAHDDNYEFQREAWERFEYLVKAVDYNKSPFNAQAAAQRIHVLLQDATLTITGYNQMVLQRTERVGFAEPDADNADARWQHWGGRYELLVSPT